MSWNLTTFLKILRVGRQRMCQIIANPGFQLLIMEHHKSNAAMDLILEKFKLQYVAEYVKLMDKCVSDDINIYLSKISILFPKGLQINNMDTFKFLISNQNNQNDNLIESANAMEYAKNKALRDIKAKEIELDNLIEKCSST